VAEQFAEQFNPSRKEKLMKKVSIFSGLVLTAVLALNVLGQAPEKTTNTKTQAKTTSTHTTKNKKKKKGKKSHTNASNSTGTTKHSPKPKS